MFSIDAISTHAYADLGDAWVRSHSTRIQQKHLQVGRHFRLDLNGLLRGLAIAVRKTRKEEAPAPQGLRSLGPPHQNAIS